MSSAPAAIVEGVDWARACTYTAVMVLGVIGAVGLLQIAGLVAEMVAGLITRLGGA